MPWKLVPPRQGKTKNWYIRGTYLGYTLDDSTGTADKRAAGRVLKTWREQAERGEFSRKRSSEPARATFLSAAVAYMQSGGERNYIAPILKVWGEKPLDDIDQIAIDTLAETVYPGAPASTKNRQIYTPVSAILKRAGIERKIKRPKGWRGNKRTFWLQPEPTFRLLEAASQVDAEFGILCTLLNYTGLRISEALDEMTVETLEMDRSFAYIGDTKTGQPRPVYLPPVVVAALANHPRGLDRKGRLFRFHDGGRFRDLLKMACEAANIDLPPRVAFHVFRHNYGTWMRRYAGLDSLALTRTGVWEDAESVERYSHSEATEEAMLAIKLPTPGRGEIVDLKKRIG